MKIALVAMVATFTLFLRQERITTMSLITEEELTPVNPGGIDWFSAMSAVVGELDGLKGQVAALHAAPKAPTRALSTTGSGGVEVALYGMLGTVLMAGVFIGFQVLNRPDIAAIERSSAMMAEAQMATVEALSKRQVSSVTCVLALQCPDVPAEPVQAAAATATDPAQSVSEFYRNTPAIPIGIGK